MPLVDKIRPLSISQKKKAGPVWNGPEESGITQSLLSRFLCCRERFRILVVEGLKTADGFNHRLEYGNLWHVCEEALAGSEPWEVKLVEYCQSLLRKYPMDQEQVDKWFNVCRIQFPVYVDFWAKHPDVLKRTPLLEEQAFAIPYTLPSGRVVKLRGKFDSVDLVESPRGNGIWLQENKTKGEIIEQQIRRQLLFDLQTMIYIIALHHYYEWDEQAEFPANTPILGVRYNVIRRPLSGGSGSIVQKKDETKEQFYNRLKTYIDGTAVKTAGKNKGDPVPGPDYWFMRWNVLITEQDIARFKRESLDPILEQLCDWWQMVSSHNDPFSPSNNKQSHLHFRMPYGVYNPLLEGNASELDEYLASGSEAALERTTDLFPELT